MNPRAYEISCCAGAIHFIDDKRKELFSGQTVQDGKHCVVYKSFEDLCEKIDYYLSHEEERRKIVDQAREYVYNNHTYVSRAERVIKAIRLKEKRFTTADIHKAIKSAENIAKQQ